MERRTFLTSVALGLACCAAARPARVLAGGQAHPHWSYDGETGPAHWGELAPQFDTCRIGTHQTPIDLTGAIGDEAAGIDFDYRSVAMRIVNNGHTIQVNPDPGCAITIGGETYNLVQFHFHHPSEHLVDGRAFEMELHLVHRSAKGGLAVVGTFITAGKGNTALGTFFEAMPHSEGIEVKTEGQFDPAALVPATRAFYRYTGSLTTPPCSEGLTWTVFREPIEASPEQIRAFAALFPNNARPVQRNTNPLLLVTGR
jgi:carbonic anhydrase